MRERDCMLRAGVVRATGVERVSTGSEVREPRRPEEDALTPCL